MFCSYYFILQTKYAASEDALWTPNKVDETVVYVYDDNDTYLEEQADGNYILHSIDFSMEVSAEDVESGLYDIYPIIEYEEVNNPLKKIFSKMKGIFNNIFYKEAK